MACAERFVFPGDIPPSACVLLRPRVYKSEEIIFFPQRAARKENFSYNDWLVF